MLFLSIIDVGAREADTLIITIPPGIDLNERDIRERLPSSIAGVRCACDTIEIVIYYYSAGTEKLSYGDTGNFSSTSNDGSVKSLIKLKKNGSLRRVFFVDADGSGKEEILANFSRAISGILPLR